MGKAERIDRQEEEKESLVKMKRRAYGSREMTGNDPGYCKDPLRRAISPQSTQQIKSV